ncbi:MAG: hypothetical protein ACRDVZ_04090 [Jiangellaceae bacterium]
MRAPNSSGIIGDACWRLLDLHPKAAARAKPQASKLVEWMIKFQFHSDGDFFEIGRVAYAPALRDKGISWPQPDSNLVANDVAERGDVSAPLHACDQRAQ